MGIATANESLRDGRMSALEISIAIIVAVCVLVALFALFASLRK
jgi:hypothetical protein